MESSHFPTPIHTQAPLLSLPAPVGTFVSMMILQGHVATQSPVYIRVHSLWCTCCVLSDLIQSCIFLKIYNIFATKILSCQIICMKLIFKKALVSRHFFKCRI